MKKEIAIRFISSETQDEYELTCKPDEKVIEVFQKFSKENKFDFNKIFFLFEGNKLKKSDYEKPISDIIPSSNSGNLNVLICRFTTVATPNKNDIQKKNKITNNEEVQPPNENNDIGNNNNPPKNGVNHLNDNNNLLKNENNQINNNNPPPNNGNNQQNNENSNPPAPKNGNNQQNNENNNPPPPNNENNQINKNNNLPKNENNQKNNENNNPPPNKNENNQQNKGNNNIHFAEEKNNSKNLEINIDKNPNININDKTDIISNTDREFIEARITFEFKSKPYEIECSIKSRLYDICRIFANQNGFNIDSLKFTYNKKILNFSKTFEEIADGNDRNNRKINIEVEEKINNESFFQKNKRKKKYIIQIIAMKIA